MWSTENSDGGKSFVGMMQFYSDKSRTTLKESAFQFYPFHITLLNFCDEYRRKCIGNGLTLMGFLPVQFCRMINGERIKTGLNREEKLKMLHLSITHILSELKENAYIGFSCADADGVIRTCHPCIGSYCCDLPEGKDITSVKNGNSSLRNCHRCMAKTNTFNIYTSDTKRVGKESCQVIRKAMLLKRESKRSEADDLIYNYSLIERVSCLERFPFVGSTVVLDLHSIFNFEPLHNFHLGISKVLKRSLSERLRAENLFSSSIPTASGKKRTLSLTTVRLTVLHATNRMLSHIELHNPAKGLHIDFSSSSKESGLFLDNGKVVGMLEGKDYKSLDMVSPFIGMLADRCCDEAASAPTTTLYVQYVDIAQLAMSYNSNVTTWTEAHISRLQYMIKVFKRNAVHLYGSYHPSGLRTEKFHQLDHIADDIRNMGSLSCSDAGLFEHEHLDVKRANRSGSRKVSSAMQETLSAYVKNKCNSARSGKEIHSRCHEKAIRINANHNAIKNDSTFLVKSENSFPIGELEKGKRLARRIRIAELQGNEKTASDLKNELQSIDRNIHHLLEDIGEVGCRVLLSELRNLSSNAAANISDRSLVTRVASGYVAGIRTPSIDDYDKRWKKIRVKSLRSRRSQRIISARGFGGSSVLRQDNVLIQASDPSPSGTFCLWVGKVLGLFRIPERGSGALGGTEDSGQEFAFVRFYDVVDPVDSIDNALGCIRLVWATGKDFNSNNRSTSRSSAEIARPWYTLIPVSSIRAVVHLVRGDYGLDGVGVVKDADKVPWFDQHFYINQFYFDSTTNEYEQGE